MASSLDGFNLGFLAKMFMNKLQGEGSKPEKKIVQTTKKRKDSTATKQKSQSTHKSRLVRAAPRGHPYPLPQQLDLLSQFETLRIQFLRQLVYYQRQVLALKMPSIPAQTTSSPPNMPWLQNPSWNTGRHFGTTNPPPEFAHFPANLLAKDKHCQTCGSPSSEGKKESQKKRKVRRKVRKNTKVHVQNLDLQKRHESRQLVCKTNLNELSEARTMWNANESKTKSNNHSRKYTSSSGELSYPVGTREKPLNSTNSGVVQSTGNKFDEKSKRKTLTRKLNAIATQNKILNDGTMNNSPQLMRKICQSTSF